MTNIRERIIDKHRIVIKIGSSSLTHKETGRLDLIKLETLVRELSDLRNQGKDVILVSSGAIAAGRSVLGFQNRPDTLGKKQACAAVGQGNLMMIYQKLFSEYHQISAQILMTKNTMLDNLSRYNVRNTFEELLKMGVIPIVNENDSVSTDEIQFGDNDTLSAVVASILKADLLILLSDIDGLFSDDPNKNPDAVFIKTVEKLDEHYSEMAKESSGSDVGTGGMSSKLKAAEIAMKSGTDMIIANGADFHAIHHLTKGEDLGTLFVSYENSDFSLVDHLLEEE